MKNYTVTTSTNLINLCAGAGIFTDATKKQTERLLVENEAGCPIEQIAAMIWMCSDNSLSRSEILDMLKIERVYFYKKLFLGVGSVYDEFYFSNFDGKTVRTSFRDFIISILGQTGDFGKGFDDVSLIVDGSKVVWESTDD